MATYLNEVKNETLYRRKFFLPIYEKDKRHSSLIFLLSNSFMGSYELRNTPFAINANRSFISYYMEPNVKYYMNIRENTLSQQIDRLETIEEGKNLLQSNTERIVTENINTIKIDRKFKPEFNLSENTFIMGYNETDSIIDEASLYDNKLKTMLYKDRIRNNKEALAIYKSVKENDKHIQKTFLDLNRYNNLNLFVDLYYYNDLFLKNVKLVPQKANEMYFKFLVNLITDPRYDKYYKEKTVFIPVKISEYGTSVKKNSYAWDHFKNINVLSAFHQAIKGMNSDIRKLDGYTFVFIGDTGYFKTDKISDLKYGKFVTLIKRLYEKQLISDPDENKDSPKAIKTQIINTIENNKSIEINNLTGSTKGTNKDDAVARLSDSDIRTSADSNNDDSKKKKEETDKEIIVDIIDKNTSDTVDSTIDSIDNSYNSDYFKIVLKDLENSASNTVNISSTRAARMNDINNKFLEKKVKNTSVKEIINNSKVNTPLPITSLDIDTVNEEWKQLEGVNFEKVYNIDEDIYAMLYSLSDKSYPVSIIDVQKEDTSTTEDHVYTYTVKCEDSFGSRFTLKFDIPRFRNDRFMKLKGNEKTLNGQLLLLPVIKTDEDTVQIVTSYKKIFIRRYGESEGKSIPQADAIIKAISKYKGNTIQVVYGDNRRICSKYELPIDYLDLAKIYSKITVKDHNLTYEFYFNQDEIREKYKIDENQGIPFGVLDGKTVLYYSGDGILCQNIIAAMMTSEDQELIDLLDNATRRVKYTYSRASILNSNIPLIIVMGYSEGLTTVLNKAKIEYELLEKRPKKDPFYDIIRFKDGYLKYRITYDSSLLLNGLKECDTENYSITDINNKEMWVDFLDDFGGRLKADGLDNFYDLTMDPITVDICKAYDLPTDYIELLAYANLLLADNKYNKHVDITGNRYRTNEQIAALFYDALAESYENYRLQIKNGRNNPSMSMKQSIVIDKLMEQPTFSDLSVFSPVLEFEAANAVSFKGKSGMNNDRSYGLDKRIYDKSMTNVLALSTGFASNVGLTRQTTIDKNISGKRGFIKEANFDDMNTAKSLCMTEALTPFGSTHDDPFRSAMTFVQTSKHSMRTKKQSPSLITNGADEALAYLCSDMFAYKSKGKGKVTEITKDYMIITYDDGGKDFIDLRENIKKNSDGGVFEILKLDTDLKVGATVKEGQVVAYDKKSFVNNTGSGNLSTSVGVLAKIAILETDEGYEDSAIISNRLSENLMSEVVVDKPILLDAKTNVYKMIKKGTKVEVGDTLMIIQNAFDDEDANLLLKNITDEDIVSTAGRIPIKSKVTGVVQDIKIYRSCELEDMSDSLRKVVSAYESNIKKIKTASKNSLDNAEANLEPTYKLPPTGKLKNAPNHVLIEFYLKYDDKMSVGDKIVYYSALKGVCKDIFPEGKEPKSQFRPDEQIDAMLSAESINGRMVGSIITTGCINKILIELGRKAREIMDIPQIDEFE